LVEEVDSWIARREGGGEQQKECVRMATVMDNGLRGLSDGHSMGNALLTASHSFKSSLSGNFTASLRFPDPKVFLAALWSS
jgi:hypothetical protein